MHRKLGIIFIFWCLIYSAGFAQNIVNQTNYWYFGFNAGLNFNTSPPSPLADGQVYTEEGSATISDKFGNLLFYTDGITVWNRNHQVMPNGTGLLGHPSSAQSGIVVPKPGSSTIFYLITVPQNENDGMRYSIVDMTLDGGLGDIIPATKNTLMYLNSSEKVAVIKHKNGVFFWVVGRKKTGSESKTYVSFLIDCDGLHVENPIISNVGITDAENWGYLVASPNGKKLASASENTGIELCDFNNVTGQVSNTQFLGSLDYAGFQGGNYGLAFSPNSKVLYGTSITNWALVQWDMEAPNIPASETYLGDLDGSGPVRPIYRGGALQLASDGKIYGAEFSRLTLLTINNPNVIGPGCDYQPNSIYVGPGKGRLGLPPFVADYLNEDSLIVYTNHCLGETTGFEITGESIDFIDSVKWDFDDAASGSNNYSESLTPTHVFTSGGSYHVQLIRYIDCVIDTSYRTVIIYEPQFTDQDAYMCINDNYTLPDGIVVSTPGIYTSLIQSVVSGCDSTVVTNLTFADVDYETVEDQYICKGESAQLNVTHSGISYGYTWSPASSLDDPNIPNPVATPLTTTTYTVTSEVQVDDNLIKNGDFENGNVDFQSEYIYASPGTNLGIANYTVHNNITNPWWGNCPDHTSGSGKMLIAYGANSASNNNGVNPGSTIWCQTVTVSPNKDYVFSAWVASVGVWGASTSNLAVYFDGVLVAQTQNGDLTLCNWFELGTFWNSGASSTVEICIAELDGSTSSNNFAIDDITLYQICTFEDEVTVHISDIDLDILIQDDISCFGGDDGVIQVGASGGFTPYNYSWDSGHNADSIFQLPAGDYTVVVTDSAQCTETISVSLVQPDELIISVVANNEILCDEFDTGSATVTISGGTSPYSVEWDNQETTETAIQLSEGQHDVLVTDANGCEITGTVEIIKQPTPDVTVQANIDMICVGEQVVLTADGAISYSWTPSGSLDNDTGVTVTATPTVTTTYIVAGTDANGCIAVDSVKITVNPLPDIEATASDICEGGNTTINATGGVSYDWDNGLGAGASHSVSPTTTTTYTVLGTDANGCENTASITVTVNPLPTVSAGADVTICESETTTLIATGADSYVWDNNLGDGESHDVSPTQTTTYEVTGTDQNGCENTSQVTVTVVPAPTITIDASESSICIGESTTLTADGAVTYTWSPSDGLNTTTGNVVIANPTITTTYVVTGVDGDGCSNTESITITINQLPDIQASGSDVCEGGSVTISASGGTSYTWDNGLGAGASHSVSPATTTTYTVTGIDANGCENSDQITINVNPLPGITTSADVTICELETTTISAFGGITYDWNNGVGSGAVQDVSPSTTTTYEVTGTDANGCSNTAEVTVTVVAAPPMSLSADVTEFCIGGQATLTVQGGVSYSWTPAGTLSSSTDDVVIATPDQTTTYQVIVYDANGCFNIDSITITVNDLPNIEALGDDLCEGGTTTISATGGVTYDWDNGLGAGASHTVSPQTPTTYQVTGIDANGCENTAEVTIDIHALPTITVTAGVSICQFDSAVIEADGGVSYDWDNGLGSGANHTVSPTTTTTYTVVGTDDNGCSNTASVTVLVNSTPTGTISGDAILCQGDEKPEILFEGFNSTTDYDFTYNVNGESSQTISSTGGNNAMIIFPTDNDGVFIFVLEEVTDPATGCSTTYSDTVTIIINPTPDATISGPIVKCVGDENSEIIFEGSNSTGDYTFTYNIDGGNDEEISAIGTNTANITVTTDVESSYTYELVSVVDPETGCSQTINEIATVEINPNPTGSILEDITLCQFDDEPIITFNGNNSTSNYQFTYTLNNQPYDVLTDSGDDSYSLVVPTDNSGTYTYILLMVTDPETGCFTKYNDTAVVIINPTPIATTEGSRVVCVDDNNPGIVFSSTNSSEGDYLFTYTVNGELEELLLEGENSVIFIIPTDTVGVYTYELLTVTDPATGCFSVVNSSETIEIKQRPIASFYTNPETVSTLEPLVQTVNESLYADEYYWEFGDGYNSNQFEPSHEYSDEVTTTYTIMLVVSNASGCVDTAYRHIEYNQELIFYVPNTFTPDGDPYNNEFKPVFSSGFDPQEYHLSVYNRWGELIFESSNTEIGWDGTYGTKIVPDGTYVWKISLKKLTESERDIYTGHINLLR